MDGEHRENIKERRFIETGPAQLIYRMMIFTS